jgi:hypothetical protein
MMTSIYLLDHLTSSPFRPFCVRTTDGRLIEIRHPEDAAVGKSSLAIWTVLVDIPGVKGPWHDVPLIQIESIEILPSRVGRPEE